MPLTFISISINFMIGITIWLSSIPALLKIIITLLLVAKFAIYFLSAFLADSESLSNVGFGIVGILDIAGGIYAAVNGIWSATVCFIILLVLLALWQYASIGNLFRKGGKKE